MQTKMLLSKMNDQFADLK